MKLFKRFRENNDSLDYEAINNFARSGERVNKLLQILIIMGIIGMSIYVLQRIHVLHFVLDFLAVISPVFIGLIIAWIVAPFTDKLAKKMPRLLACIIVYLLILGILALLLIYIIPSLVEQIKVLGGKIPTMVDDLQAFVNKAARKLGFANSDTFTSIKKNIFNSLESIDSKSVINVIIGGATSIASVLTTLFLSLMVGFYFLLDYKKLSVRISSLIPKKFKKDTKELKKRVNQSLRSYIQGVLIVMFFVFISQTIGLSLAGHDSPMLFALICAVTDIIPFFGPWIGAVPAVVVGFLISPLTGIFTIISILVVQTLENNIYQPIIMGKAMKLHPITIIASLLVFGHFFGILGMIFATPIVATIKLLFQFVDEKINFMDKIEKA